MHLDNHPLAPYDLWRAWSFEPAVIVGLALSAWLYWQGVRALRRSAGPGRGVRRGEIAAFVTGWVTVALALLSPVHRLGSVLFSAHMVQHELLMVAAAPLLILGRPLVLFLWALPMTWRRALGMWTGAEPVRATWSTLTRPSIAWTIHAAAIWVWHVPALFQATLESEVVHSVQHLSFLGSALLFWWALLRAREGRLGAPAAVVYLFTTAVHTSILGALLTFSSRTWYPLYHTTTGVWGLTPLEDQQLAGLLMWIPAGVAFAALGLVLFAAWLHESDRRTRYKPAAPEHRITP